MSKTLLLADDSVVIQKLVGLSFANEDVEIVSTDNGDDAVIKAREVRPDLVLADVVMPGKSGYEVCEAIKKDPALAHIPVLLLTGTFEAFDEARAQAVGATGHITKPFEAQALVERVKTVIKNAVKPAPTREAPPSPSPLADDLFDEGDRLLPPPARTGFFGTVESLDVTPSLSEEDLSDSLDVDLFGPPGDVGGPTPRGGESFTTALDSLEVPESQRFADAPIEDATVAVVAEPMSASLARPATDDAAFGLDLGLDDPIDVQPLPAAAFDLDSAFDPAPASAPSAVASTLSSLHSASPSPSLSFANDDANAATSRSFGRPGRVADLDEMLAAPEPVHLSPPSAPPRPEILPEAPTRLDFGPAEQSSNDLDFGFDVSEQTSVSQVDLLDESFSSLLDVSESQILGDSAPSLGGASAPAFESAPAFSPASASVPPPLPPSPQPPVAEFDVSSSDLATAAPLFSRAEPLASSPSAALPELDFSGPDRELPDFASPAFAGPPPLPASAESTRAAAVAHMSPILQQQVQETLEKVAWEAFSDLSETIVKQVLERIERIAWEVIPQMAETLVREEIRKMKGEND
jgi:CheY-like chemotaxis protein